MDHWRRQTTARKIKVTQGWQFNGSQKTQGKALGQDSRWTVCLSGTQFKASPTQTEIHKWSGPFIWSLDRTYLWGPTGSAGLCVRLWHRHYVAGRLSVFGVGIGGAVAGLSLLVGTYGGDDLHSLAACGGAVAMAVSSEPSSCVQP